MQDYLYSNSFLAIAILVFVAVLLFLEGSYLVWRSYRGPEARQLERRLQTLSGIANLPKQSSFLKQRSLSDLPMFERLLLRFGRIHLLERFIQQSGLQWTVSRLLLTGVATGGLSGILVIGVLRQGFLYGVAAAAAGFALPLIYVRHKRAARLARIERQLPDALDMIVRALRSGHAFSAGLQMAGDELADPIAAEFRAVHDEVTFGVSLQQALTSMSERVPITDLRYFVVSVLIQRESGGNLTEVLENLSNLVRERLKLFGRIRVLSSEGRLSAWILVIMPFALGGIMAIFNPKFMAPLWTDPIGITIIKYLLALMAIGVLILQKIIRIRV